MNFGDILEQWDKQQKQSSASSKRRDSSAQQKKSLYEQKMKEDSERVANPMEVWMRRYGVIDKDAVAEEFEYRSKVENREFLRNMRPEETIDLHGLTRDEAWARLDAFVASCKNRGLRKILIIQMIIYIYMLNGLKTC